MIEEAVIEEAAVEEAAVGEAAGGKGTVCNSFDTQRQSGYNQGYRPCLRPVLPYR